MTLKCECKVIENDIIRKLGYGFLFAFHMALSCIICEIKADIDRKWQFFYIPAFDAPIRAVPVGILP